VAEQTSLRQFIPEPTTSLMSVEGLSGYTQQNPLPVDERDRQEAARELSRRGITAQAPVPSNQSVMAAPKSINPFNPAFRETARSALNDFFGGSNIAGREGYRTGQLVDTAVGAMDFIPGVGDAVGVGDLRQSIGSGDLIGTAIDTTALAAGMIPVVGDAAAKVIKKIGDKPLRGAPSTPNIPNVGTVRIGQNPEAEAAAVRATEAAGVPYTSLRRYVQVNPEIASTAAREYDIMQHTPDDPVVASAYNRMIEEMMPQYDAMLEAGVNPYFMKPGVDPYANSPYEALIDVYDNKRLAVFPSVEGFGSNPNFDPGGNPLLRDSGRLLGGQPATYNDIFRAVHDYYGHAKPGVGFRAMGEENAYQSHAGMFSPEARRAVASETRGQNSFLNFGPYGEANRTANIEDTIFADQKTGLMPRYVSEAGLVINDDKRQRFFDTLQAGESGLQGAITDDGKLRLIHYSPREIERIDPERYGRNLSGRTRAEQNRARGNPDFVKRSYYGVPASQNPYRPESGVGRISYEIEVEPELMYDLRADPDNIRSKAKGVTEYEKLISNSGYTGYYIDDSKLGKVAAIFDPYDVKKVYTVPLVAIGALGMMGKEDQQPDS